MFASSSPKIFSMTAPSFALGQGHAQGLLKPRLAETHLESSPLLIRSSGGDSVRFGGGRVPLFNYSYWWAEHQKWFPKQRLRIATALEAGANKLRTWFAGAMMALPTMVPMPDWLMQKISRDYFYSPRKVFNPLKFQSGEQNKLNPQILSNSFQVEPLTQNLNTIHSFYLKAGEGKPTIVFSHGRDTNIGHLEGLFKGAQEKKYGFFAYDYPGFGRSEGHPDEKGLEDAGIAACRFLASDGYGGSGYNVPYEKQIIMGYSLGGAVAVKVANKFATDPKLFNLKGKPHQHQGLILVNTFADIKELYHLKSNQFSKRIAQWSDPERAKLQFDSSSKIAAVKIPTIVFHCKNDNVIPPEQGKALYEAAKAQHKDFIDTDGNGHRFNQAGQCAKVIEQAEEFFIKSSHQ
jgi:alpha-beta hydrolase superfamily lysophospholipase